MLRVAWKYHWALLNLMEGNEPWHGFCNQKQRKRPGVDKKRGHIKVRFGKMSREWFYVKGTRRLRKADCHCSLWSLGGFWIEWLFAQWRLLWLPSPRLTLSGQHIKKKKTQPTHCHQKKLLDSFSFCLFVKMKANSLFTIELFFFFFQFLDFYICMALKESFFFSRLAALLKKMESNPFTCK